MGLQKARGFCSPFNLFISADFWFFGTRQYRGSAEQGARYWRETCGHARAAFPVLKEDAPAPSVCSALRADCISDLAVALSKPSLCPLLHISVIMPCLLPFLQINCDWYARWPISGLPRFQHHLS